MARQLVDRIEVGHERESRLGREDMRLQLDAQRLRVVAGDGARGNRILGPGDDRRGDEESLPGAIALHHDERLGLVLDELVPKKEHA